MQLAASTLGYLRGETFSTGFQPEFIPEPSDGNYVSRVDILKELCAGKKIIHVGCVDHNPETVERKRAKGTWLHQTLTDVSARVLGVDIEEKSIAYLQSIGVDNVMVADITNPPPEISSEQWDYVVIPEVIEHIGNPVAFLKGVRAAMSGKAGGLILTTPNAFSQENFKFARGNKENINSDHRFWFTPYTLSKIVMDAGYTIGRIHMCKGGTVNPQSLRNLYLKMKPMLRNNIVMTATF